MEYTVDEIRSNVSSKPAWAQRAVLALYARQTADEQRHHKTAHINGAGFNGLDAPILTSFAKRLLAGRPLSPRQLEVAYKKLPKYAKQLHSIAGE